MDYTIVFCHDKRDIESQVNRYIENGWKPQGGISIMYNDDQIYGYPSGIYFAQAMIKERK